MNGIAFVGSTLPIPILKNKLIDWNINKIILSDKKLYNAYNYLLESNVNFNFKILYVPSNKILSWFYLFFTILNCKINSKDVYFFHECCWLNFDILVLLFRIKSYYFPQVTLDSFIINKNIILKSLLQKFIFKIFNLKDKFNQYKVIDDNDKGFYFILSVNIYPSFVQSHPIIDSLKYRSSNNHQSNYSNNILLLVGTETIANTIMQKLYMEIINDLYLLGFKLFLKNHPREDAQLFIPKSSKYISLNPQLPVELIEDQYFAVIGCASTSLYNFNNKVYSVLNFCGMDEFTKTLRKKHLLSLKLVNSNINFPNTKKELVCEIQEKYEKLKT